MKQKHGPRQSDSMAEEWRDAALRWSGGALPQGSVENPARMRPVLQDRTVPLGTFAVTFLACVGRKVQAKE